jgi:4-aminobutyrate aminotransferase-like enzyme
MSDRNRLQKLRKKYLSQSFSLSYNEPLHLVRGRGQYLYDSKGNEYLDAVNNIQHVGHSHPKVTEAANEQFKKLNTNTRYLDKTILDYARALTDKLPSNLNKCYFTNSGSESNDLALRIARNHSNSKETIVLEGAYHGHVTSLIEISPYKHDGPGGKGPPEYVHVVPMPDPFRGIYRGQSSGLKYAAEVKTILDEIRSDNKRVSAFIFEPILGCGGQIIPPNGFLSSSFKMVRDNNGVCIADEVQVGFGRMGESFWGFETQDIVPDIVTLGKSIGNGHPLSVVVTSEDLSNEFNNGMEYFNSFGGNPVSCAIGHAVLKVIEEEELQKNAFRVGNELKTLLNEVKSVHDIIGDVRGKGLFLGIEIIKDLETLEPDKQVTHKIVNEMRNRKILLSSDGPDHNVIKVKPPMVFNSSNALFLVETLDKVLSKK